MNTDPEPQPAREANLVADTSGAIDRAVQQDLERIRAESLLARQDSAQELTRGARRIPGGTSRPERT